MLKTYATVTKKIILWIYALMSVLTAGLCLFGGYSEYAYKKYFPLPDIAYVLTGLSFVLLIGTGIHFLMRTSFFERFEKPCIFGLSAVMLGFTVFATHFYYFKTGWDAGIMAKDAAVLADGNAAGLYNAYYSIYPNNVFLTVIFSLVIRVGRLIRVLPDYYLLIVFQCFSMTACGVMLYFATRRITGKRTAAALSWILFIILGNASPWVVIPYSDTVGMLFMTVLVILYAYDKLPFLIGFILITGYYVKPGVLIFGIALLLSHLPGIIKNIRIKKTVYRAAMVLAGFIAGFITVRAVNHFSGYELDAEKRMGMSHYLMMGLNEEYNGVINIEDQNFSFSIPTAEERRGANLKVAWERLKNMGFGGFIKHLGRKMLTAFNDGSFAWACEGEFITEYIWTGQEKIEAVFRNYYYPDGKNYGIFLGVTQSAWMAVLVLGAAGGVCNLFGCLGRRKTGNPGKSSSGENLTITKEKLLTLLLTIVGTVIYEMVFEPRARHILVYLPIYIMVAANAYYDLTGFIYDRADGSKNE